MTGILDMMGYIQAQGEAGKQSGLNRLLGQAYGDPSKRDAVLGRMAQTDGKAAFDAQSHFEQMDDKSRQRLGQRLAVFSALPDEIKAQAYPSLAAEANQLGIPAPGEWNPEFAPHMQKIAQALQTGNPGVNSNVQSTYIDAQGNRVAIMRDGSTAVLGQNAPSNQIIDTGNGFYGVNKGNLQAAPVMIGGQQQPPQQQAPSGPVTAATGQRVNIDPSLPENVRASIMAAENAGQPLPGVMVAEGQPDPQNVPTSMGMPQVQDSATGGQLRSAPKPAEALQIARFNASQTRTLSPEEVAAKGYRPGTIVQVDGFGNEKVRQAPAQDRQSMSEAQRKDMLARKAKVPQLQNAIRGMGRIESALKALEGGAVNTGPLDAMVQRYTPAGQELDAAVGGIQNSILALTRVPGIGAQSDLEARIAALQYPSLDKPPEVNRRTLDNLKLFMRDLAKAYESAIQQDAGSAPSGDAPKGNGWSIQAVN